MRERLAVKPGREWQRSAGTSTIGGRGGDWSGEREVWIDMLATTALLVRRGRRGAHTATMRDVESFHGQAIADFNVAATFTVAQGEVSAFREALKGDKASPAFFVGEVGPDDVVEDVGFDSVDGGRESSKLFRPGSVLEGGCINSKAGEVVEVRMSNEVCGDEVAEEVERVGFSAFVREKEVFEGAGSHDEFGAVGL